MVHFASSHRTANNQARKRRSTSAVAALAAPKMPPRERCANARPLFNYEEYTGGLKLIGDTGGGACIFYERKWNKYDSTEME